MKNRLLLLFSILSHFCLLGQTNEGTEFWFGFMEHVDVGNNTMVAMVTSKKNTGGTIEIRSIGWRQNYTVSANQVTIITLPKDAENIGSENIGKKGIHLTANDPVSVYIHQYHEFRSEAAAVLPKSAIGNAYYTISYQALNKQRRIHPSEFLIIANEDETNLSITVNDQTLQGKTKGTTFQITLNQGETYQVQSKNDRGDLTGSLVTADKNFSLFSGNSWTDIPNFCGTSDNLLEQMFPISTWGRKYLTVPTDKVDFDIFRILAAEDGTEIEVQETNTQKYNLDKGEFVEYQLGEASFIEANKPILVVQYLVGAQCSGHTVGDPSMVLLNSIEQTRDTVTLFNSQFLNIDENFINVIARTADVDIILFDGQKLVDQGVSFMPVGKNENFSFARVQVQPGAHTVISEGCGIIATAYGYGPAESYAYSGGASFSNININPIPEGGCLNDTVFFDTGLSPFRFNFNWDLGDGNFTTEAKFMHFYPELGAYPVQLILEDQCLGTIDTLNRDLLISLRQAVDTEPDISLCEGETFQLGATDLAGAKYLWEGPAFFESTDQFPIVEQSTLVMNGRYNVIGIVSGCATRPAAVDVEILANPHPDLGEDAIICTKLLDVLLEGGDFADYTWSDGNNNATFQVPFGGGLFWVDVVDEFGCIGSDTINLIQQCPTVFYIPTAFSPNQDGTNDVFQVLGSDIIEMNLQIFNRWGTEVFASSDLNQGWDGMINGQPAEVGVYIYKLEYMGFEIDGDTFSDTEYGTVTLVR